MSCCQASVQFGVGNFIFASVSYYLEWYHLVVVWPNILSAICTIYSFNFSKRRLNSEKQVASSRRAKDEEPVVCSRTASKLIVETVKVIGYN